MALSSEDLMILSSIGHDIVQNGICIATESFLMAVYAVLALKATNIHIRGSRTWRTTLTLVAIGFMFVVATVNWIIDIVSFVEESRRTLVDEPGVALADKYSAVMDQTFHLTSVQATLYSYMSNVGDAVIIWRAYVFWSYGRERFVILVPLVVLAASFITSALMTYCVANIDSTTERLGIFQKPAFCRNIQMTSYCTAIATTASATLLIATRMVIYRKSVKKFLVSSGRRTRIERIGFALVESGLLYFLFFVLQLLMSIAGLNERIAAHSGSRFALTMVEYLTSVIAGIYPTAVIVLVHSAQGEGVSVAPSTHESTSIRLPNTANQGSSKDVPISFAPPARTLRWAHPGESIDTDMSDRSVDIELACPSEAVTKSAEAV